MPLVAFLFWAATPADIFMLKGAYPGVLPAAKVRQATKRDPELSQILQAISKYESFPQLQVLFTYNTKSTELSLYEGCLLLGSRGVIPRTPQKEVLRLLYVGHPGIEKTKMISRSHMWWPGMH